MLLRCIIWTMSATTRGEPVPCGGCPGGYFCTVMNEDDSVFVWQTVTLDAQLYGCEYIDRDGMHSAPTIIQRQSSGEFIVPSQQTLARAGLFEKDNVSDPKMAALLKQAGQFCVHRIMDCPGPRKNYASSSQADICPAGLGQTSIQLFILQLNRIRRQNR